VDIGDLATWIGSSFAAVAAGATLWTLKSQRDQLREQRAFIGEQSATLALEREALRAAAEDRRWAQARLVRMHHRKAGGEEDGMGGRIGCDHWDVTVVNSSDAPVREVEVRFGTAHIAAEAYLWNPHWSDTGVPSRGERVSLPVHLVGPGRGARLLSQRWPEATVHNNLPMLYFTDDSGVRWVLDPYGKLEELPPEPNA